MLFKQLDLLKGITVRDIGDKIPVAPIKVDKDVPEPVEAIGPAKVRFRIDAESTVISEHREWPHQLTVLFAVPVTKFLSFSQRDVVYMSENYLVNGVGGWIITFLAVVVTSFFIPNLMSKGYLDLFISKPIGRVSLLVYKYFGGLTFMALLTSIAVLGVYLVLGIRTGIWAPNFLLAIPLLTLQFAILYAVSTLFGVLTRSAIVAMLATVAAWLIFFAVGKVNDGIRNREIDDQKASEFLKSGKLEEFDEAGRRVTREQIQAEHDPNRYLWSFIPPSTFPVLNAVHNVFPRTFQLDSRIGRVIAEGVLTERQQKQRGWDVAPAESWPELLGVNFAFIALMLGLASWRFVTRDG